MQTLDLNQFATVYMTTMVNHERIADCPPLLPFAVEDPDRRRELLDNAKSGAHNYDMYKDIVQVSFLYQDKFTHLMYCDDPEVKTENELGIGRDLIVVDSEERLVAAAVGTIQDFCPETHDGVPLGRVVLGGWKIRTDLWPTLVNKAFAHGYNMPRGLLTDPLQRFSTIDGLLEISNIYTQGINMSMRKLPALGDVLLYWGFDDPADCSRRHLPPDNVRDLVCTNPKKAVDIIEPYLEDMRDAVHKYYAK